MKSHPLHVWHHRHFIWHHIHTCCQHTIVCMSWHTLCLWHHMNSMWHHNQSLRHHKTVFMTLLPNNSWLHTHCIWHDIHSTCDVRATVTMTRHLICFWHYTQGIRHLTCWMNHNTTTVSDMILNVSLESNPLDCSAYRVIINIFLNSIYMC